MAGAEYPVVSVCKPHDCEDHNTVLLYDAAQGTVMGKVYEARRGALIGNPPPALASEIEKLWVSEWRRKP